MPVANLEFLNAPIPGWISALFVVCTALTAVLLGRAVQHAGGNTTRYWVLVGLWLAIQAGLALAGIYQVHLDALPPRLVIGGILPTVIVILGIMLSGRRRQWLSRLPLASLATISVVRIGVEVGLYGLAMHRLVPELMTFEGRNFDIVAGLTALVVAALLRRQRLGRGVLLGWHVLALALLANIVVLAMGSAPSPVQQLAFEQPNVAVLRFPVIWLPTFIVPVVLFSHVASLYQLILGTVPVKTEIAAGIPQLG